MMHSTAFHQANLLAMEVLEEVKSVQLSVQESIILFSVEPTLVDNSLHNEVCLDDRTNFAGNSTNSNDEILKLL